MWFHAVAVFLETSGLAMKSFFFNFLTHTNYFNPCICNVGQIEREQNVSTIKLYQGQTKDVSKRGVIDVFTCERHIFYSVKTEFFSERNPCNSLIYIITWDIIYHLMLNKNDRCNSFLAKFTCI